MNNYNDSSCVLQAIGNNCGHSTGVLRDIIFPRSEKRPKVIKWMMDRVRHRFKKPQKYFLELREQNKRLKDNSDHRVNRSEGREALMQLSLIIFYHLELSSMSVRKDDYALRSMSFEELTDDGNLLSISRARRALNKLVKAGYIKVTKQFEKAENIYHALASIKEVLPRFFVALGMGEYYSFSQSYKRKILEKRGKKRRGKMERFDTAMPFREVKYEKVSKDVLKVVTSSEINNMRKELYELMKPHFEDKYESTIQKTIMSCAYETLKKRLEHYRQTKPPP